MLNSLINVDIVHVGNFIRGCHVLVDFFFQVKKGPSLAKGVDCEVDRREISVGDMVQCFYENFVNFTAKSFYINIVIHSGYIIDK